MNKETWLDDCRAWCRKVKFVSEEIQWSERPNHSGWLKATSMVLDVNRVTIPRLLFSAEYKPGKMGERISYGLMYLEQREQRRVFMLEVYPEHERSHMEPGLVIFGPHIHLGDERLKQITRKVVSQLDGVNLQRWIERFRRHARILDNERRRLVPPFTDDLFG